MVLGLFVLIPLGAAARLLGERWGGGRWHFAFDVAALAGDDRPLAVERIAQRINDAADDGIAQVSQVADFGAFAQDACLTQLGHASPCLYSFADSSLLTNSVFTSFNPSYNAGLDFEVSQPLLRNFGFDVTRGEIRIALAQKHQADESWPFAFDASQAFRIKGNEHYMLMKFDLRPIQGWRVERATMSIQKLVVMPQESW